ncbi:hypothetical protein CEQ90_11730 [Lewinellaceae bacterium SD302]|nr:hypothetical protein CEQ90_11730 [Lewinellaceae bacterium SD302]
MKIGISPLVKFAKIAVYRYIFLGLSLGAVADFKVAKLVCPEVLQDHKTKFTFHPNNTATLPVLIIKLINL